MHNSLFGPASTKREVYSSLQDDYERDTKVLHSIDAVAALAIIAALANAFGYSKAFWFVGIVCALSALRIFIDQSNRNWAMHVIDWTEHRDEREGRAVE